LYRVVEHSADESIHDGEALDFKISALLAAQAAIAAIFIEKGWSYIGAAFAFTLLTGASMLSLRLWRYGRAPEARLFAEDFIKNQAAARKGAILSKLQAIDANERLVGLRSLWFNILLIATIVALVVFLGWYGYNGYENGHRTSTQGTVCRQSPGPSRADSRAPGDSVLGGAGKRSAR
jgi:hypothetical protein